MLHTKYNGVPVMIKTTLGVVVAGFISLLAANVCAEDNALTAALPNVTALTKKEECSAKQHNVMSSLGLGETVCTVSKYVSFDSISKAIGISAFQPNSRVDPLNPSDNVEDFVRYSPTFFTRLNELYSKDTDHMIYGFLYKHFLTNSTRLFYMTGKDMRDNKKLGSLTLAQYKQVAKDSKPLFTYAIAQCRNTQAAIVKSFGTNYRYSDTFKYCGKSATASLFWYRRQLDGSNDALFKLLDTILKTQDPDFYSQLLSVRAKTPATTATH